MKVKELIKELEEFNPESEVGHGDHVGALDREPCVRESVWTNKDGSPKDVIL